MSPNPILVVNSNHMTLQWSPPFLWPGHRIQQYEVHCARDDENISTRYVSSSYLDEIVSLSSPLSSLHQSENLLLCQNVKFNISAIDDVETEQLTPANVSYWIWVPPSCKLIFFQCRINFYGICPHTCSIERVHSLKCQH